MSLLKCVSQSPVKVWHQIWDSFLKQGYSRIVHHDTNGKASVDKIIEKYENDILFNSVIERKKIKLGYKKNNIVMQKKIKYNEQLDMTLKTIQPLPLSLKYYNASEKYQEIDNVMENVDVSAVQQTETYFPYHNKDKLDLTEAKTSEAPTYSIKEEVLARKGLLKEDLNNWMQHYDNYEFDLVDENEDKEGIEAGDWKINYGTPDPKFQISQHPCGGCGAHLHCKDTSIPGYIPSDILKNCFDPNGATLGSILCQRCYFLKQYNIAIQVRVSPEEYPKILNKISLNSSLVVLIVDLIDFPCSIWPGLADIIGSKVPIIVAGNKVDLLPKDDKGYLHRIKKILYDNVKLCGFASTNIKHIELISATTGYGIERLINALQKICQRKGNVYLVGCTNVGKSSLFNAFLQSDFCKIQAADLIQRATTSPWPGTTLNLLKFPITRLSGYRLFLRTERLKKVQAMEKWENQLHKEVDTKESYKYATLIGHIGQSFTKPIKEIDIPTDGFSVTASSNLSGRSSLGISDKNPDYVASRWCYDTPGVVHPDQIIHLLTIDELVKTLPKSLIKPETFNIQPGTSLFIAALARLDYVSGPDPVRLTIFRAKGLPLTLCKTDKADHIYKELLGTDLFAVPIDEEDNRLAQWPGLELAKQFQLVGKSVKESSYDVVLSSAGWVAVNCNLKEYHFQAWTPEKRGVFVRDPLLPKAVTLRGARVRNSIAYKKHKILL